MLPKYYIILILKLIYAQDIHNTPLVPKDQMISIILTSLTSLKEEL